MTSILNRKHRSTAVKRKMPYIQGGNDNKHPNNLDSLDELFKLKRVASDSPLEEDPLSSGSDLAQICSSQDINEHSIILGSDDTPSSHGENSTSYEHDYPLESNKDDFLPEEILSDYLDEVKRIPKVLSHGSTHKCGDPLTHRLFKDEDENPDNLDFLHSQERNVPEVMTVKETNKGPHLDASRQMNKMFFENTIPNECVKTMDVLFGRGKRTINHPGNKWFREMASRMASHYEKCSKVGKTALSNSIVEAMHMEGIRFLSPVSNGSKEWIEVKGLALRRKTSQALRDSKKEKQALLCGRDTNIYISSLNSKRIPDPFKGF